MNWNKSYRTVNGCSQKHIEEYITSNESEIANRLLMIYE